MALLDITMCRAATESLFKKHIDTYVEIIDHIINRDRPVMLYLTSRNNKALFATEVDKDIVANINAMLKELATLAYYYYKYDLLSLEFITETLSEIYVKLPANYTNEVLKKTEIIDILQDVMQKEIKQVSYDSKD